MPLVASSIPNLVSGVSQQPAPSRLRTSAEAIENGYLSIVSGMMKRPPMEFVNTLANAPSFGPAMKVHMIDRSQDEKYILLCNATGLAIYNEMGQPQTVSFPDGTSYLDTAKSVEDLKFVTVADTTFVLNSAVTVTRTPPVVETRPDPRRQASVFVKRAVASVSYAVYIDNVLAAQFATSDNTTANTALEGTSEIAAGLAVDAVSKGWTGAYAEGTTVIIPVNSGQTVQVDDEFGGAAMEAYTSTLQAFEDLPPREAPGRLVKIQGKLEDRDTAYWVEYSADGVWVETYGYQSNYGPAPSTMPHVLRKLPDGTFEFRQGEWKPRLVGDDDSNPHPTFLDSKINNLFLFKGRLGFLSEENVIMSEVTELENFYLTTAIQSLDTDPIDVASATGRVSTLYQTATFSDELILFSDRQQFRLTSGTVLSGDSVGITSSTSFPCSTYVSPVTVGSSAYFAAEGQTNASMRELIIDSDRESVEGEDITVQVPKYLPAVTKGLAASSDAEVLLSVPADSTNEAYVYKWYRSNQRKVQSAWNKWVFDDNMMIGGMGFLDKHLYIVYSLDGVNVVLGRMNASAVIDKDLLLDHQMVKEQFTSSAYDSVSDTTTVVLPMSHPETLEFHSGQDSEIVPIAGVVKVSDDTYTLPGDMTTSAITCGLNYDMLYEFSTQYLIEETSDGDAAIQDGRLQLRYFSILYTDTSYFEVHVTPTNGPTKVYVFNGRVIADPDNVADVIPKDTGEFKVPIFAQNEEVTIQIRSNKPYECSFSSVEWTAVHKPRARRL